MALRNVLNTPQRSDLRAATQEIKNNSEGRVVAASSCSITVTATRCSASGIDAIKINIAWPAVGSRGSDFPAPSAQDIWCAENHWTPNSLTFC